MAFIEKICAFIAIVLLALPLAALYGAINDQLTYSISPEYYTKFKFQQFRIAPAGEVPESPRLAAAKVGVLATWWMGLIIGIPLAFVGFIHRDARRMLAVSMKAAALVMCVTFLFGFAGLLYGKFYLAQVGVFWRLPEGLLDRENFIAVGSMHNFSYLGGLIGLLAGIIYSVACRVLGGHD